MKILSNILIVSLALVGLGCSSRETAKEMVIVCEPLSFSSHNDQRTAEVYYVKKGDSISTLYVNLELRDGGNKMVINFKNGEREWLTFDKPEKAGAAYFLLDETQMTNWAKEIMDSIFTKHKRPLMLHFSYQIDEWDKSAIEINDEYYKLHTEVKNDTLYYDDFNEIVRTSSLEHTFERYFEEYGYRIRDNELSHIVQCPIPIERDGFIEGISSYLPIEVPPHDYFVSGVVGITMIRQAQNNSH